jgi:transposase
MVWGGVSSSQKTTLVILHETVNAQRYLDNVIEPIVIPFCQRQPEMVFMQDNAPAHRSRIVSQRLQDEEIQTMEWPANSPDPNPIEHVWDQLKRAVYARETPPASIPDLRMAIQEEWDLIGQNAIQKLINSMNRRCQAVISARGGHTRY